MSTTPTPRIEAAPRRVVVEAPARLHMGFVDLSGGTGRRFGSLGLTLEGVGLRLSAERSANHSAEGPDADRALRALDQMSTAFDLGTGLRVNIERNILPHVGLGSGTQLALAAGAAAASIAGLQLSGRELGGILDRGARSGIGIGAFEQGGFLVDGGRGPGHLPPPVTARLPFPRAWRVLLLFDFGLTGLSGGREAQAFKELPPFPDEGSGHLCRLTLMHILPALADEDLAEFGAALSELQRVIGDYFAPAQGGRYTSARVAENLAWLESQGVPCVGQSSWGPTGFAVVDSEDWALALLNELKGRRAADSPVRYMISQGRNRGASIEEAPFTTPAHAPA